MLDFALRHGALVQVIALVLAVPSFWLAVRLGTQFLPRLDEGALMAQTVLPSDASLAAVDEANRRLREAMSRRCPASRSVYRRTGRGEITEDPMPHSISDVLDRARAGRRRRRASSDEIEEIAEELPFGVELTTPMGMRIAEGIGGTPGRHRRSSSYAADLDPLRSARGGDPARARARSPGVRLGDADTGAPLPAWRVVPDEDALRRLDVPRDAARRHRRGPPCRASRSSRASRESQRIERVVRFPNDGRLTGRTRSRACRWSSRRAR